MGCRLGNTSRSEAVREAVEQAQGLTKQVVSSCWDVLLEAELQLESMSAQMEALKPLTAQQTLKVAT